MMRNYKFLIEALSSVKSSKLENEGKSSSPFSRSTARSWMGMLALLLAFVMGQNVMAQTPLPYTFTQTSGTYVPLVGGTSFQSGATLGTNAVSGSITIPFTFNYNGANYTSLVISNNGFITFGTTPPAAGTVNPISANVAYEGAVAGFGINLVNSPVAGATPDISYGTDGSDFVVQFTDLGRTGIAGDRLSFQIRLTQTTNVIKIVYNNWAATTTTTAASNCGQVGLRGSSNTAFLARMVYGTAPYNTWATSGGAADNGATASQSTSTAGPGGPNSVRYNSTVLPANGLTYTYTPVTAGFYQSLPYSQNFETWQSLQAVNDVPGNGIISNPATGNQSPRAHNETTANSVWGSTSGGASATPGAAQGTKCSRFHCFDAASGLKGYMDFYLNFSTAGNKSLSFDMINTGTTRNLRVFLSTDGGITFGSALATYNTSIASWTTQTVNLGNSTSATCVVRFEYTSDFAASSDIGLDNVNVVIPSPCVTPTAQPTTLVFGTTTTTAIAGSFTAASPAPSKYLVVRSTSASAPSPVDGTTYAPASTALGAGTYVVQNTSAVSFSDSGLTAGTQYYYYIFSYNDNCTGAPFYLAASPLSGSRATVCSAATAIGNNTVTTSGANITWTGTGNYIVEYGATGFTPGTGASAGTGGTIASSTATSPYALGGLSASTTYQVYVRQVCALGGYSANSSSTSFTTLCAAVTTFPATEAFGTYLPNCWFEGDGGSLAAGPTTVSSSAASWDVDGWLNSGSTGAAKINIDAAADNDWLITPYYTLSTGMQLKYSVAALQWNTTTALTTAWEADDFVELVYSTDMLNWQVLKTYNASNVPSHLGQVDTVSLSGLAGSTVHFAFRGVEGASNGGADIDFMIDNFIVEVAPSCVAPGGVTVTQLTPTTASVSWTGAASAVVEWGASACTPGTGASAGTCGNVLVAGSSPQTITGLVLGNSYNVSVRQDCTAASNGYSANTSVAFTHTAGESCAFAGSLTVYANSGAAVNTLLTTGLTADGPAATCSDATGNPNKKDRWVKFTAPSNGNKIVITTASGTISDAVMQVWSGCPGGGGTLLGCSDDVNGNMPEFELCQSAYTGGQEYYVQIWPYSATSTGNFNVKIYEATACPVPPSNDECAGVVTLTVGAGGTCPANAVTGTTVNATATAGVAKTTCDSFGTYLDVFYKFNSGSNTSLVLNFTNLTGTCEFGLYSACGTGYLSVCSSATATNTLTSLTPNTDYYIVVWSNSAAVAGTFSLCVSQVPVPNCVVSPTAPTNASTTVNPCGVTLSWASVSGAASYDVYLDAGAGPATTLVSTSQTGLTYNAGTLLGATAYSWRVVPKNGSGSAVGCSDFTFTTLGAPACVASPTAPVNASTICGGATTFSWPSVSGATSYDVYIDNTLVSDNQTGTTYSTSVAGGAHTWRVVPANCIGEATACVDFTFTANAAPLGDTFATPIVVPFASLPTTIIGDNLDSNCWHNDFTTSSTPGNSNARGTNDVFYTITTGACTDTMTITTVAGSTTTDDTYIHLLSATGTTLESDDDDGDASFSTITYDVAPNTTYYIVVETFGQDDEGSYTMNISTTEFTPSTDPTSASSDAAANTICAGGSTLLTVNGGSLGSAATWHWYTASCGGTAAGTGPTLSVNPTTTTTYYVRAEGSCGMTNCASITITVNQPVTLYADTDGDGFGNPASSITGCAQAGYVTDNTDCDDTNNAIHETFQFYVDADHDTYGTGSLVPVCAVDANTPPVGYSLNNTDCNDGDAAVYQSATLYVDADNDGYTSGVTASVCYGASIPSGYIASLTAIDCNDSVGAIHPNAVEVPYNGVDDDCDNTIDETGTVTTTLLASSCGTTLTSIASLIGIQTVGGHNITGYRIRATNGAQVQVIEKNVPHFTMPQFPSYAYATTYTIEIQLQRAGIWQASWGTPCFVSTPAILEEGGAAAVSPSQCGIVLPKINTLIATSSIAGVTGYRFRITNLTDTTGPNQVQTIDRVQNWFSLQMLTRYNYGTTYRIEVAVKTTGAFGGFGAPCEIMSPAVPSLINCGGTATSGTQTIAATSVSGATQYRFQITRQSDNASATIDKGTNYFIFNSVPPSAFTAGALYTVRVAVMTTGTWSPFGDACEITAPGGSAKGVVAGANEASNDLFKARAYPNPFTADFAVDVTTSAKGNVQLRVYDMLGKLVESREVTLEDLSVAKIGLNYPSGVYNVIVTQDNVVKTLRVVKR